MLLGNPSDGSTKRFNNHAHMMTTRVEYVFAIDQDSNMALPENEIASREFTRDPTLEWFT